MVDGHIFNTSGTPPALRTFTVRRQIVIGREDASSTEKNLVGLTILPGSIGDAKFDVVCG